MERTPRTSGIRGQPLEASRTLGYCGEISAAVHSGHSPLVDYDVISELQYVEQGVAWRVGVAAVHVTGSAICEIVESNLDCIAISRLVAS